MNSHNFDAVIFDLDGVITKTAEVHSKAWTRMFNDYLKQREEEHGEKFEEFSHEGDYLPFVDGKPRYKGVADFLKSRQIDIPYGDPSDDPDEETVCGLGNRKNEYFTQTLNEEGVEVYESTVELIRELQKEGIRLGVASSSKNCKMVLETAGLLHYFETRVDGMVSAELGLKGKPEPDIFTTACDNLGVAYDRSVVVEDAVSGVQAGAKGGFGFTLGLDREGNREALVRNGADIVLNDIDELGGIPFIERWFQEEVPNLKWNLVYRSYDKSREKSREAILSAGNGFFATRGSLEEINAGEHNYPGSYMAGLYNRRKSKVGDRWIENEDFVNFINWIPVSFRREGEEWFNPNLHSFSDFERRLDLRNGLLYRRLVVNHEDGAKTELVSRRFVSMANPHLAGLEYIVRPLNYSGTLELKSQIDGDILNEGVERYSDLDQHHLDNPEQGRNDGIGYVIVRTNQSDITISVSEKLRVFNDGKAASEGDFQSEKGKISTFFKEPVKENKELKLQKLVCVQNSRDFEVENPLGAALVALKEADNFDTLLEESAGKWAEIWEKADLKVDGDRFTQMLLRMHIYHLMVTASTHHTKLDAGIPARGLHGEAYRGHIFWDELYVLPFYISHFPEIARSVLMYRYRRMEEAAKYAREYGYEGTMFPWQSGSDGREETQIVHLNPVSGEWGDDYSSLQRHISIAIAYNIWQYYHISGDQEFMDQYGAEMFFGICRFWASKSEYNEELQRYHIDKVMGPDEFHEKLPDAEEGGLKDNAYTNIMVVWLFNRAFDIMDYMRIDERKRVVEKIGLSKEELVKWKDVTHKMNLIMNEDGILSQFDGYFDLKELDWDAYRKKYENIHRMDRILKSEGKSPDDFKVAKQADVLMTYYNIDQENVNSILKNLGFGVPEKMLKKNFDYYISRTSHGSTLSRVVHAFLAREIGESEKCWEMYVEALVSDYIDIQGGTTGEGIHMGVMGGTVLSALTVFAGLNWHGDALRLDPSLPSAWKSMEFSFRFKGEEYHFRIDGESVQVEFQTQSSEEGRIFVRGRRFSLLTNETIKIPL